MAEIVQAREPFKFSTRLHLIELMGLRVSTLDDFLALMRDVPGSSIYYHTHRFLQQHQFLSPEPPNDFAYWVSNALGELDLGERLASIDIIQFPTIRLLREKMMQVIEDYLKNRPSARQKFAGEGSEFHFMKAVSFIIPTGFTAMSLQEFLDILGKITIDSIYYHIFEARLRLEKGQNDFSYWLEVALGEKQLAAQISRMDPYTHSMEDLRRNIMRLVERRIASHGSN